MLIEMRDISEFHKKFELDYKGKPRGLVMELIKFRSQFMHEEVDEWASAVTALWINEDEIEDSTRLFNAPPIDKAEVTALLSKSLDALIDLIYVTLGTAYLQGFKSEIIEEAWQRVHEANMKKVRATKTEDSKRESTFDVVKPPGWTPPNHDDLVEDHIYAHL